MTRSSTKELLSPLENPKRVLRSRRKLFDNPSLVELNPSEEDQLFEIEEHIEEEVTEIMAETMEQYMSKTREDYGGSEQEDANEHIEKGPHYTKDCPQKEEGKTLEEAYYTQFGAPYQPGGQYRAAGPGFYQRNNRNSSYPARRETMEESLAKFMAESAKRHEENSNIIKEIQASTDAAIRNQGASIKTLELQIGQMSKVLQERGFGSLPGSTETNPRDQVKSISTATADLSEIRRMEHGPYAVSGSQHRFMFPETVPFPRRLHNYCCDGLKEAHGANILDAYDDILP
ncbi:hypothetical protein Tco_0421221 [Tanacetum coccineum]